MTADDQAHRRQDREEAALFSSALENRAMGLLREGASIEAVAEGLHLPLGAVRYYQQAIKQPSSSRKRGRPDWSKFDAALLTRARHLATSGADADLIAQEFGLPLAVAKYVERRAGYHRRRAARKAARAGEGAGP